MERLSTGARTLEKALDLLFSFDAATREQSLMQISRRFGFPPSTTRRLLKVMISRRLIEQDERTQLYRLGFGVMYLASLVRDGLDIRKIALPIMERLMSETGENIGLHELRDGKRVCVEKVESREVLRDTILIGDQFPAHCGATGKALLAFAPEEELQAYLKSRPLEALTPRTITDPKKLLVELAKVRRAGFAFSCGERVMDGLCAISAPIFESDGRVRYTLTITLTPFRLRAKGRERLVLAVRRAADEISRLLAASPTGRTALNTGGRAGRQPAHRAARG
ncbi:MAG TPA: IclR family transcriptional regulator [candidate division Zixibacteria bacterium]|nr:IclR family transcriptional regulator [candidate division Zixibacteria bacterium]